jgi:hypothetical protein
MQPRTCTRHSAGARAAQSQTQRGSVHSAHQVPAAQSAAQRRRRRPAAAGARTGQGLHRAGAGTWSGGTQGTDTAQAHGHAYAQAKPRHRHSAGSIHISHSVYELPTPIKFSQRWYGCQVVPAARSTARRRRMRRRPAGGTQRAGGTEDRRKCTRLVHLRLLWLVSLSGTARIQTQRKRKRTYTRRLTRRRRRTGTRGLSTHLT